MLPALVFLLEKFCGQRGLAGYCPWGRKESGTTEQLKSSSFSDSLGLGHSLRTCTSNTCQLFADAIVPEQGSRLSSLCLISVIFV